VNFNSFDTKDTKDTKEISTKVPENQPQSLDTEDTEDSIQRFNLQGEQVILLPSYLLFLNRQACPDASTTAPFGLSESKAPCERGWAQH